MGVKEKGRSESVVLLYWSRRAQKSTRFEEERMLLDLASPRSSSWKPRWEWWRRRPATTMTSDMNVAFDGHHERKYAVIVDAGSSGSRLTVYSWENVAQERATRLAYGWPLDVLPRVELGAGPSHTHAAPSQIKIEPGLSAFEGRTHELRAYLDKLLAHVRKIVPTEALPQTPIYILATAGMRLLKPEARQAILLETCRIIREQPFYFEPSSHDFLGADTNSACDGYVRVISGEEEGLLGWLAVNYLMNEFRPSERTYGFLDMGGASTQIAFEPPMQSSIQQNLFEVPLHRLDSSVDTHRVFVTTFLGFGTNAARTRYLYALTERLGLHPTYEDPCLPKGLHLPLQDGTRVAMGTGSYAECLSEQLPLLDRHAECREPPCLFHGVHVPPIDFQSSSFVGVSEYWYSSDDVFRLGGMYDHDQFHSAATEFCASDWRDLESKLQRHQYPEQLTLSRLQMQCFKAAWMSTILHEGLRLPRVSNTSSFQSINHVRGLSVSWTLGKALQEASRDVEMSQFPPVSSRKAVVSNAITIVLLVMVCIAIYVVWRRMYRRHGRWTPLSTKGGDDDDRTEEHSLVVTMPEDSHLAEEQTCIGGGSAADTKTGSGGAPQGFGSLGPENVYEIDRCDDNERGQFTPNSLDETTLFVSQPASSSRRSSTVRAIPKQARLGNDDLELSDPSSPLPGRRGSLPPRVRTPGVPLTASPRLSPRSSHWIRPNSHIDPSVLLSPLTSTHEKDSTSDSYVIATAVAPSRARSPAPSSATHIPVPIDPRPSPVASTRTSPSHLSTTPNQAEFRGRVSPGPGASPRDKSPKFLRL